MAVPDWPVALPYKPLREPFDVPEPFSPPAVTDVEDGPKIQRRWGNTNWTRLAYQLVFTRSEYDIFDDFVRNVLGHGASRFNMPVARPGTGGEWPPKLVYIDDGAVKGPKPYGKDGLLVSFTLVVLNW